ncbi:MULTISPECIES: hypothetical protein [unclassified Tenacibaculum]|uniref:hypothetical protein n=1 Tax=unclassified Tenacibaculum TaxID=2635139 RepID=UPI001F4890C3|nr:MULTISPECIES: hypothetical protein [unclassified Tenacibaculum]MCF2876153.1 hypothetical protein [Tenacibaculum sp. Cn5-1]MCF2936228.1 hypothetical protein [Tenacibaculum sp. Cn5-34]MCG7511571.1 hypothetical protein [Tenacibaculum sp. Cn5-46]
MINLKKITTIQIVCIFIWIGFIASISFMEAWLKFKAEGVTTEIGLSIGRLVFKALNTVEISLAFIILISILISKNFNLLRKLLPPYFILVIQSIYLLPVLDSRAIQIIQGISVDKNYDHLVYVLLELLKITTLILIGIQITYNNEYKS